MSKLQTYFFIVAMLILQSGCNRKKYNSIEYSVISTGYNVRLNSLIKENGVWLAVGGNRGENGIILRSTDIGITWTVVESVPGKSLYAISKDLSGKYWCGGEYIRLLTSPDGVDWATIDLGAQVPFNEEDRPAIRSFAFPSSGVITFSGGENLGEGVLYRSTNAGLTWDFESHPNELKDLLWAEDNIAIVAGHGALFRTDTTLLNLNSGTPNPDFYTSLEYAPDGFLVAASYDGSIYRSGDKGINWSKEVELNSLGNRRINFNDLISNSQIIVTAGNNGVIGFSTNSSDWRFYEVDGEPNFYSVWLDENLCYLASDDGKIYIVNIQY